MSVDARRLVIGCLAAVAAVGAPAAAAPLDAWLGDWRNDASDTVVGVTIARTADGVVVTAQGACSPEPCEWGEATGILHASNVSGSTETDTDSILAIWDDDASLTLMTLDMTDAGSVMARTYTRFHDESGRSNYSGETELSRPPLTIIPPGALDVIELLPSAPLADEDCIPFDPASVEAKAVSGRWKVVSGDMWMLDADTRAEEMVRSAEIIQHYGLTAQCFVGRGASTLAYWKTPTGAPVGALEGEDCLAINPAALSVREDGGRFTVVSDDRQAAFTAPSQALAERAITVIGHYGFTQSCFVGRPDPSMRYLRK